ncbi:uncharacterized protein LOC111107886 isoform X2 [Crassostrea virginica]
MQFLNNQAIVKVLFTEMLFRVLGLNAKQYTWFEAQEKCRVVNSTLISTDNISEFFWTRYYHRKSQWIGIYGCYQETNLTKREEHHLHFPSAGLCQEYCLDHQQQNDVIFFAIKDKTCFCLENCPDGSPEAGCSFSCLEDHKAKCGGKSVYSVFLSRNMRESDENLHPRKNVICSFNITHPVDKFCSSICDSKSGQCINLTRHVYTSYDRGQKLSKKVKKDIQSCQICSSGCSDVHCKNSTNKVHCTNGKIFPARRSSSLQPPTRRDTKSMFPTTSISTTNITRDHSRLMTTEKVNKFSTTLKNSVDLVSCFANASSTVTMTQSPMDNGNQDDFPFQVGFLVSTIGISIICMGLFAYCMRKSIYVNLAFLTRRKRNGISLPTGYTLSARNDAGTGGLESNHRSQNVRPSTQNYSFNYILVDNNKLGNQLVGEKEEQYHHVGQQDFKYNENDNYMMVGYNSNTESVHFVEGEDHYNYLRENRRSRFEEDDTYSHANNMDRPYPSDYSVVNMKRNSREIIGADLYDHFESRK